MENRIYQRVGCCLAGSMEPMDAAATDLLKLMYTENTEHRFTTQVKRIR